MLLIPRRCVCERERDTLRECVCVREREWVSECSGTFLTDVAISARVCVWERERYVERERERVCVCVSERERERERERELMCSKLDHACR